jgi:hypothetical protein
MFANMDIKFFWSALILSFFTAPIIYAYTRIFYIILAQKKRTPFHNLHEPQTTTNIIYILTLLSLSLLII